MRTEALDIAFRETSYRVDTAEGVFDLRIGRPDPAFDDYLRRQGISCWSVLTACNPGGVRDDDGNRLRFKELERFHPTRSRNHRLTGKLKRIAHRLAQIGVVFNNQDGQTLSHDSPIMR